MYLGHLSVVFRMMRKMTWELEMRAAEEFWVLQMVKHDWLHWNCGDGEATSKALGAILRSQCSPLWTAHREMQLELKASLVRVAYTKSSKRRALSERLRLKLRNVHTYKMWSWGLLMDHVDSKRSELHSVKFLIRVESFAKLACASERLKRMLRNHEFYTH